MSFSLGRPTERAIEAFLDRQADSSLTYEPVGLSSLSPAGYNVDECRRRVGEGERDFERAKDALDTWRALSLDWIELHPAGPSPVVGTDVAVTVRHLGFWSLHACRVVQRFPTSPGDSRYGFSYGTLREHAECGEELFAVELDDSDGSVWYQVRAVSRPRALLARLGYPVSRWLQRKFREDSVRAMAAAVRGDPPARR